MMHKSCVNCKFEAICRFKPIIPPFDSAQRLELFYEVSKYADFCEEFFALLAKYCKYWEKV